MAHGSPSSLKECCLPSHLEVTTIHHHARGRSIELEEFGRDENGAGLTLVAGLVAGGNAEAAGADLRPGDAIVRAGDERVEALNYDLTVRRHSRVFNSRVHFALGGVEARGASGSRAQAAQHSALNRVRGAPRAPQPHRTVSAATLNREDLHPISCVTHMFSLSRRTPREEDSRDPGTTAVPADY